MAFLYRLLPPRSTFAEDMSPAEAEVMQRHVAYWRDLNRDVALAFGPVLDAEEPWAPQNIPPGTAWPRRARPVEPLMELARR